MSTDISEKQFCSSSKELRKAPVNRRSTTTIQNNNNNNNKKKFSNNLYSNTTLKQTRNHTYQMSSSLSSSSSSSLHSSFKQRRINSTKQVYYLLAQILTLFCCIIVVLHQFKLTQCYNLDAQKALQKRGPKGSYFGYSIAQHSTNDDLQVSSISGGHNHKSSFKSYIIVGAPKADHISQLSAISKPGAVFKCELVSPICQLIDIDPISINSQQQASTASAPSTSASDKLLQLKSPEQLLASQMTPTVQRDNQWLGVSVKSQEGTNGYAVACAHKHVLKGPDFRWAQGICYSLNNNLTLHKTWQPCYNRPVNRAHEEFGFCQAGISSDISESADIVIGSPGPHTWRGSVFSNSINFKPKDDKTWYMAPVTDKLAKVHYYSYLGMSLISGKFFNKQQYYVSGAIRANGTGQVLFMTKQQTSSSSSSNSNSNSNKADSNLRTDLILSGDQHGSGFGYSLAKLDFNGDSLPDIAISAPFYFNSTTKLGGAVYVYVNGGASSSFAKQAQLSLQTKLFGKLNSRFGFALANAGDLNKDKYEDLAVGAPYDVNGGSVYIFMGSSSGIKSTPAQIIRASTVSSLGLSTFGYSLSGGLDMDQNGYPDLAVGSYADDSIFILRGRPIVQISTSIDGNLTKIDPNKTLCDNERSSLPCFKFSTCFELDPSSLGEYYDSMKLKYRIEAETFNGQKFSRVQFQESENTNTPNIVEREIPIEDYYRGIKFRKCHPQRVYIRDRQDIQTPIDFKLTYSLVPLSGSSSSSSSSPSRYTSSLSSSRYFQSQSQAQAQAQAQSQSQSQSQIGSRGSSSSMNELSPPFPLLNQDEAQRIFSARYLKDCANDLCETSLEVDGTLAYPKETLGVNEIGYSTDKQINVTIRVTNSNEPAYDADLYITHPSSLTYNGYKTIKQVSFIECSSLNKTSVKCELGNPMTKGTSKLMMIFDTHNLAGNFDFNLLVNTTSFNLLDAKKSSFDISANIKKKQEIVFKPKYQLTPTTQITDINENQEPPTWLLILAILLGILLFCALIWCLYVNNFFDRPKSPYRRADTEDRIATNN